MGLPVIPSAPTNQVELVAHAIAIEQISPLYPLRGDVRSSAALQDISHWMKSRHTLDEEQAYFGTLLVSVRVGRGGPLAAWRLAFG
jgi:hypothetical protein